MRETRRQRHRYLFHPGNPRTDHDLHYVCTLRVLDFSTARVLLCIRELVVHFTYTQAGARNTTHEEHNKAQQRVVQSTSVRERDICIFYLGSGVGGAGRLLVQTTLVSGLCFLLLIVLAAGTSFSMPTTRTRTRRSGVNIHHTLKYNYS